jgi:hypothetical protein
MSAATDQREAIVAALKAFEDRPLAAAARELFATLGYKSDRRVQLKPATAAGFLATFDLDGKLNRERALIDDWQGFEFLFQLTDAEIQAVGGQLSLFESAGVFDGAIMESYVFLAIELRSPQERTGERAGRPYTRSELAQITRAVNRPFTMPAMVLFRHGETLTFSVIDRRLNRLDAGKDVLAKVTVIKDIRCLGPHRAHVEILAELALRELHRTHGFTSFAEMHKAWRATFDIQELNKRFYQQLQHWYFWALGQIGFPDGAPKDADGRDSLSLIRLLTRLLFVWFIKEKGLVPETLFDERVLAGLLRGFAPASPDQTGSVYYRAILQNLFFATLNQEPTQRGWARDGQNFMAHSLYRHRDDFADPDHALDLFRDIPFLNGGLFECLDKDLGENRSPRYLRVDGFSRRPDSQPCVPDALFFGPERDADLSPFFAAGKKKSRPARVRGLIRIFQDFKFTVEENTPLEEDVALDPELLGRVFENLLAAYNPETQVTARKQTGSFYTPREIVDYMTGQALFYALRERLGGMPDLDARLQTLLAYDEGENPFGKAETARLIAAIDSLKVLDPACGSGAFPMGVLHRLVHVLGKLDPGNERWKERQLAKAAEIPDVTVREKVLTDIDQAFSANELGYGRKLYLIENCLYGVDIQPIACQIAKLRFFISLVVEQRECPGAPNRGIRPLPNLETKVVAANTLVGIERPEQLLLRNQAIDAKEAELRRVRHEHFLARTPKTKARYREEDARLRGEIATLLREDGWDSTTARLLSSWDPYDQNAHAEFFDPEWMFGICVGKQTRRSPLTLSGSFSALVADELTPAVTTEDGFDVVIGNPPYIGFLGPVRERDYLRSNYVSARGRFDYYLPFIERGLRVLADGGVLSFICPTNFTKRDHGAELRGLLLATAEVLEVCDFGDRQIFSGVLNYTGIFTFRRGLPSPDHCLLYKAGHLTDAGISINQGDMSPHPWVFASDVDGDLLQRFQCGGVTKLSDVTAAISEGIVTGKNDVYLLSLDTVRQHGLEPDWFRACARGREIRRYFLEPTQEVVFYPYHVVDGNTVVVSEADIRKSPRLWTYLMAHKAALSGRGYFESSSKRWYELWCQRDMAVLGSPKILVPELAESNRFAVADPACFYGDTACGITARADVRESLQYLAAVLNSAVIGWYYGKTTVPKANGYRIYKTAFLKGIPIRRVDFSLAREGAAHDQLVHLVVAIAARKSSDTQADVVQQESEIDARVARLYGLTEAEFAMVLQSGKLSDAHRLAARAHFRDLPQEETP